jgi:hypothetical protein
MKRPEHAGEWRSARGNRKERKEVRLEQEMVVRSEPQREALQQA